MIDEQYGGPNILQAFRPFSWDWQPMMQKTTHFAAILSLFAVLYTLAPGLVCAQPPMTDDHPVDAGAAQADAEEPNAPHDVADTTEKIVGQTKDAVGDIAETIDESDKAKEVSAGILEPIYALAELLSWPAVHWVAFALMATGVVSFALQLVLAKLVVLSRLGFSLTEILSDLLGLAISVVGLVLTTQAAAENSDFTQSPAAVLSATAVGVVAGFIFYWWAQRSEVQALEGRRARGVRESK